MLISSIVLAVGQISVADLPLINVAQGASRPKATPFTPGEPSTLALALIGIGLIAAYVVIARRLRANQESQRIATPTQTSVRRKAA